jgi:hypothetical protein
LVRPQASFCAFPAMIFRSASLTPSSLRPLGIPTSFERVLIASSAFSWRSSRTFLSYVKRRSDRATGVRGGMTGTYAAAWKWGDWRPENSVIEFPKGEDL